jgi:hypothetical protein
MKKLIFILSVGHFIGINAQAGSNPNPVNYSIDLYPKTPEAAALSKFVDLPAGNYTGVADFSIPLYTIEFDGEKIPIDLKYTTTGVTVGQIATRVGLGWVLNTGPSLSQQVIGTQDRVFPRPIMPSTGFNPNNSGGNGNDPSVLIALAALGLDGNGPRDIQPDIFTCTLLNGSGKFILNPAGNSGIPMPYNQTKITAQYGYPNDIVDEKGFQYTFFNQTPSTKTKNTCVEVNPEFDYDDPDFKIFKIKSPKNQEIKYVYAGYPNTVNSKFIPSITTQERVSISGYFPPAQPVMPLPQKCINKTDLRDNPLTEIQFKGGKILFTYNNKTTNPRLDLDGEVYLTGVIVKNDKNETIKDFTLSYDYFTSLSSALPTEVNGLYTSAYNKGLDKRLKLVSVKDNLTNGTFGLEYYETYNGKKLPIRISNDQDYWGVYNGKENGKKAISISRYDDVNIQSDYIRADKNPDINYGRLGNLKKITYPTGGYSEIQYEADEYDISDNPVIIYDYEDDYQIVNANDNTYPTTKIPFTISDNTTTKILSFVGNPNAGSTTTIGRCTWNIRKVGQTTGSSGQLSGSFTRNDPPGNYELWITRDDNYPSVKCFADYDIVNTIKTTIDTLYTQTAGTIRVSKIESVDNNNGKIVREYGYKIPNPNYTLPYTNTSGVNQGEEMFLSRSTQKYPLSDQGHYAMEVIVSNNPGWQTTTVRGKPVGYDYVQENYIDYNTSANSYRKEYKFKNERIIQYHDPNTPLNMNWPVGGLDRGLLEEELLFDSTNHLVKKTFNEYDYDAHFNTKYSPDIPYNGAMGSGLGIVPISKFGQSTTSYTYQYTTYPLTNSWIPEKKTTVTEYANNGTDALETVKTFQYSIPDYKHTYRTESYTTGSMGEILKTTYKYPQDIASGNPQYTMMQGLVSKNQLSDAIITQNYTDNLVTSEVQTLYDQFNTGNDAMILPKYIYVKKGANATLADRKITYNSYDTQGNLTQYTLENGTPISVIWGYNKAKPVAKIEGAFFGDIKDNALITAVVNAAENDNLLLIGTTAEQTEQDLIVALDNLRKGTDFLNYQITTYSYDPLVGVRSVTPPSGIREYYNYDNSKRLQSVYIKDKNASGNEIIKILKEYKYNYKP